MDFITIVEVSSAVVNWLPTECRTLLSVAFLHSLLQEIATSPHLAVGPGKTMVEEETGQAGSKTGRGGGRSDGFGGGGNDMYQILFPPFRETAFFFSLVLS